MRGDRVSPTRRASRATLPARGREANGASRRKDEARMRFLAYEGEQKGISNVQR
jgi:hypothetical protein